MCLCNFLYLALYVCAVLIAPIASAHDHGADLNETQRAILAKPAIHELIEFLEEARAKRIAGEEIVAAEAGKRLLDVAFADVVEELRLQPGPTLSEKSFEAARKVAARFNPVKLGKWILVAAREQGPAMAVGWALSELIPQIGVVYAVQNPKYMFLLPAYFGHVEDFLFLGVWFGGPQLVRTLKLWNRYGGLLAGARERYEHLLSQRKILPLDWSQIIDTAQLSTGDGAVEFAILHEGVFARAIPLKLRVLMNPRKEALKEHFSTVSIDELEESLEASPTPLHVFRAFRSQKQLYAAMLVREISSHEASAEKLRELVLSRLPRSLKPTTIAPIKDPRELLASPKLSGLARTHEATTFLRSIGASQDLIAQQLLWYFKSEAQGLREHGVKATSLRERILGNHWLRRLCQKLDSDSGLARIAASPADSSSEAQWEALYRAILETHGLLFWAKEDLFSPAHHLDHCEELLLSAESSKERS